MPYVRSQAATLRGRLVEPRRFIQVVAGPRQVGKTTLVRQVTGGLDAPVWRASADEPTLRGRGWIAEEWEYARIEAVDGPGVLVIDEVQKAEGWAESVKRLWDEDTANRSARGRDRFRGAFDPDRMLVVGPTGIPLERFLSEGLESWLG